MGEDLDSLEFEELRGLEHNVDVALKEVRHRKARVQTLIFWFSSQLARQMIRSVYSAD